MKIIKIDNNSTFNIQTKAQHSLNFISSTSFRASDSFVRKLCPKKLTKYQKFEKKYEAYSYPQEMIRKAYESCLTYGRTLDKYALKTLNSLFDYRMKEFAQNQQLKKSSPDYYKPHLQESNNGDVLSECAEVIKACKDNTKCPNKENLDFGKYLYILTDIDKSQVSNVINSLKDAYGVCSKDNIDCFKKLIYPAIKAEPANRLIPDGIINNDGTISSENLKRYITLYNYFDKNNDIVRDLSKFKEFRTKEGVFDDKFIEFFTKNGYGAIFCINYSIEALQTIMALSKNKDGSTNWEIAKYLYSPISALFQNISALDYPFGYGEEMVENAIRDCEKLAKIAKDRDGNFTEEGKDKLIRFCNENRYSDRLKEFLELKTIDEVVGSKNIYEADKLLVVLKQLKNEGRLNAEVLNEQIEIYGSLFRAIINTARNEKTKKAYSEIMKLVSEIKGLDYSQKDENGIPALEQIIYAENEELLDAMVKSSGKINYYPKLDELYPQIQEENFKNKLKNSVTFRDLESAAELCSVIFLKKLSSQFESPFCDKDKMVFHLWDIAKNTDYTEINKKVSFGQELLELAGSTETQSELVNRMANDMKNQKGKKFF